MYTVETHIRFLRELRVDEALRIEVSVLGSDTKRVHLWAEMHAPDYLAATQEVLLVHVIPSTTSVGAMDPLMMKALADYQVPDLPAEASRSIRPVEPS